MATKFLGTTLLMGVACITQAAHGQDIRPGTLIDVRTSDRIDARDAGDGRIYNGTIAREVRDSEGRTVIPEGAPAELIVRHVGQDDLAVDLESVRVGDRRYGINAYVTEQGRNTRNGVGENRRTGEYVGGGAILGTLLGAIAGGGKGAAIGAVAGGAVGAGAQMSTRGHEVHIPQETVLSFRMEHPLTIAEDRGVDRDGQHYHRYDEGPGDGYRRSDGDQIQDNPRDNPKNNPRDDPRDNPRDNPNGRPEYDRDQPQR